MRMTTTSAVLAVLAASCCTQTAAISDEPGLRLSRSDLGQLKKRDRAGVFSALRSFDDRGLTEREFVSRALELMDAERAAGLAEARKAGDWEDAWTGERFEP